MGVIYAAVGPDKYVKEAHESALSVRAHCDLPIALVTNKPSGVPEVFTHVIEYHRPENTQTLLGKVEAMRRTPFERTLFLDTDTYACGDITPVFDILNVFELSAALAPRRINPGWDPPEVPEWLPEFNTGVVLFRKTPKCNRFLDTFKTLYLEYDKWNDQMAFRSALNRALRAGIRFYTLPPEWHARILTMIFLGGKAHILHGREEHLPDTCKRINEHHGVRIYIPTYGLFKWSEWRERLGLSTQQ